MKLLSRRTFLGLGAFAAGGAFVAARSLNLPGLSLYAPTPGQPLPALSSLPTQRGVDGIVRADLRAVAAAAPVGTVATRLLTYNSSFPGPVLRLREGDRVQLGFKNDLTEQHTNLHLHGLPLSPAMDDPFRHGHPGDSKLFDFSLPAGTAGTYWYHPHPHGAVAIEQFSGMAGAVVVDGPLDKLPELQAAEEHLLMLSSFTFDGVGPAAHTFFDQGGKEGTLRLVNGALQPVLTANKGTLRLRLVNSSTSHYFNLRLESLPMHQIVTDNGYLEQPIKLDKLQLVPGASAEVLVQLDGPGPFVLRDDDYELLRIVAPARPEPTPLPARLARLNRLDPAQTVATRQIEFGFTPLISFTINGQQFDPNRVDVQARQNTLEIWELTNKHHEDHPFHLHSYPFQIIERNGQPEPYLAWHNMVNVPYGSKVRLAVPFRDYSGRTVFHCHISEHEDNGMVGIVEVI